MKLLLITAFGFGLASPVLAQTPRAPPAQTPSAQTNQPAQPPSSSGQREQGNPALKNPQNTDKSGASEGSGSRALSGLEAGSNSFTEGQARSRMEEAGYTNISDLQKSDQGIWQGKAQKDGRSVTVGLDYKGNIGVQ
jgi:hypothetical protein